jgi:phenylpropionate dioxygenase-like ring-hydroxylating dioxygenase large terminal subunit
MEKTTPSTDADAILRTGILNQWYLVARSEEVSSQPLGITRLKQRIVLWRDSAGEAHAVEDFCPHRGAALSKGVVVDSGIACKYHGVVVDPRGRIAAVPPVENCPLVGQKRNRVYPLRESNGAVFLYFSDGTSDEVPDFWLPDPLTSPEWSGFLYMTVWDCHYSAPLDNRVDPIHGSYLHDDTFTLAFGKKSAVIKLEEKPEGFEIYRDNQAGVNIDRTLITYRPGNNIWIETEIPYPRSVGGNFFRILGYPTPIDENRTLIWFFRYQRSSGWRRDVWRFFYRNRLDARHAYVADQDKDMIETIGSEAREREGLFQTDVGVVRLRRLLARIAQEQADKLNDQAS